MLPTSRPPRIMLLVGLMARGPSRASRLAAKRAVADRERDRPRSPSSTMPEQDAAQLAVRWGARDSRCLLAHDPAFRAAIHGPLWRSRAARTSARRSVRCQPARSSLRKPPPRTWRNPVAIRPASFSRRDRDAQRPCMARCAPSGTGHETHARAGRRRADASAARARTQPDSACGARRAAPADDGHARRDDHGAIHPRHWSATARARHRRERMVLPRSRRDLVLAPVQSPGQRREALGCGETARPVVHLRQALLVVQHVRVDRFLGHATPDVYGRRSQAARRVHAPCGASRRTAARHSGSSRCSGSGGPRPTSNPPAGSAKARCAFSSVTARR